MHATSDPSNSCAENHEAPNFPQQNLPPQSAQTSYIPPGPIPRAPVPTKSKSNSAIAMASPLLPPNPSLVAILLVVQSRAGPRFVFHYPPHPRGDAPTYLSTWRGYRSASSSVSGDSGESSDIEDWSSEDDGEGGDDIGTVLGGSTFGAGISETDSGTTRRGYGKRRRRVDPEDEEDEESEHEDNKNRACGGRGGKEEGEGPKRAPWETVCGFSTEGLEKILSPGKGYNKKRFEVGLEPLVFLGYPCHLREDGLWKKKREKKKKRMKDRDERSTKSDGDSTVTNGEGGKDDEKVDVGLERSTAELGIGDESLDDDEDDEESTVSDKKTSAMTMFNVVFVLNPPDLEYQIRVQEMYENVAKKFAKALKYEQARSNYVWTEAELILSMKDKAKENGVHMNTLWQSILNKSTLAKAMSEVYVSVSASKIAHVIINNSFDVSLQIPIITETSVLPSLVETQMPGLWLTTANSFDDDENVEDNMLAKHFALLFLDDVETILKEIETEPKDLSGPLAHYVRCSKPTMSFLQVSIQHEIPLTDIQILARHLIYWRRARAIPPLHQRDTYIVSPNADMKGLRSQSAAYSRTFPTLPSLPKMLSMLSGKPRPYNSIIPSKDHRQAYLDILAWLVRGGWVTQLRTFAWVYVCKEVKIAVAEDSRNEVDSPTNDNTNGNNPASKKVDFTSPPTSPPPSRHTSAVNNDPGPPDIAHLNPPRLSSASTSSISSTSTIKGPSHSPDLEPSIILEPHKANALESRWLEKIAERLEEKEARDWWPVFTKYFNGQHALEKIAVRECLTRKDVRRLLGAMEGALIEVRHW